MALMIAGATPMGLSDRIRREEILPKERRKEDRPATQFERNFSDSAPVT
jgi:hypothetical protein